MGKIEFVKCNGYLNGTSYVNFTIRNGNKNNSIGDQLWISPCGTELEITDMADSDIIEDASELFLPCHKKAFIGALHRIGFHF